MNFDYPYLSKSITEFGADWHISLGTWFREYVYIPLGGNRKGKERTILNSDDCMVFNRPVAWRELEFRDVGNVLRNTFDY